MLSKNNYMIISLPHNGIKCKCKYHCNINISSKFNIIKSFTPLPYFKIKFLYI